MAQLTDDCFAFSGPLLPVDEVRAHHPQSASCRSPRSRPVALNAAGGRVIAGDGQGAHRPSAVRQFRGRRATPCAMPISIPMAETRLALVERVTAGRVAAHSLAAGAAVRIFTGAPMPRGRRHRLHAGGRACRQRGRIAPPGLKLGANRRLAGEDARAGSIVLPRRAAARGAGRRPCRSGRPARPRRVPPRFRVAVLSTGDEIAEPGTPLPAAALLTPTAPCWRVDRAARRRGHRSRHPARRPRRLRARSRQPPECRLPRHLGRRFDRGGRPRPGWSRPSGEWSSGGLRSGPGGRWRWACRRGKARPSCLPGNPAAVYVTFARVVRPLLPPPRRRASGAARGVAGAGGVRLPQEGRAAGNMSGSSSRAQCGRRGRSASSTRRRAPASSPRSPRPMVWWSCPKTRRRLAPGATVGFLSYAALVS